MAEERVNAEFVAQLTAALAASEGGGPDAK